MNKNILATSALAFLLPLCSSAGGFKIGLQGQKQLAMGHTGVGFAQDAATIYFNPAGLSFVPGQVNLGGFGLIPTTGFLHTPTNTVVHASKQVFTPFSLYAGTEVYKGLSLGLGVYTPFGSGVTYPTNWTGRYVLTHIALQTVFIQPTASYRFNDKISVGAGFVYSVGTVELERDLPLQSYPNNNIAHARLQGMARGIGFNAGVYVKPTEKFNAGLTYHSKVAMKVKKGEAQFTNVPSALESSFPPTNTFTAELPLPSELALGTGYRITSRLAAALDVNYTFWQSFDSLGFDYGVNSASLTDTKSPRLYQNALALRAGLRYRAHSNVLLMAGAFYDQTPVQDGYVAPELPDNNKFGLTAGVSWQAGQRLGIDISLLYEHVGPRTQTNIETGLEGTFRTHVFAPGLGINYRFN